MEVQDKGNETEGVLGVGYDGDFVCDLAICVRILRGSIVRWCGVEEALGLLLDTQRATGQSAQLGMIHARQSCLHSRGPLWVLVLI